MGKLGRVCRHRREEGEAQADRFRDASRRRLLRILQKKLRTSFIGALAKFETHFGRLWGHGLDESECTPEQLAWREVWEQARTEVLNNGNGQLRAVEAELPLYTVVWDGYQAVMPAMKEVTET